MDSTKIKLTKREKQILQLIATGKASKDVAVECNISKRTIDFHLANIYENLNVKNRMQAVNKAKDLSLI